MEESTIKKIIAKPVMNLVDQFMHIANTFPKVIMRQCSSYLLFADICQIDLLKVTKQC